MHKVDIFIYDLILKLPYKSLGSEVLGADFFAFENGRVRRVLL